MRGDTIRAASKHCRGQETEWIFKPISAARWQLTPACEHVSCRHQHPPLVPATALARRDCRTHRIDVETGADRVRYLLRDNDRCVYRKSDSAILVMKAAKDRL